MAVAVLTRESVRRALSVGIRADQIIDFLREHAHAQMRANGGEVSTRILEMIDGTAGATNCCRPTSTLGDGTRPIHIPAGDRLLSVRFRRRVSPVTNVY
jgi:hypothetical protein